MSSCRVLTQKGIIVVVALSDLWFLRTVQVSEYSISFGVSPWARDNFALGLVGAIFLIRNWLDRRKS